MTAARIAGVVLVLALVGAYATLAVRWTASDRGWYAGLRTPRWQPPDVVFGVVWPLNFLALGVAGTAVVLGAPLRDAALWLALLAGSVALALGWAHEFYVPHRLGRAAALLAVAASLTWLVVGATVALVAWAGWVLVPYAVWLSVATGLAVGYWRLAAPSDARAAEESSSRVHPGR